MSETNKEKTIEVTKNASHSPLFAENDQRKAKRMMGLKIIGFSLIVMLAVIYMVFRATSAEPPRSEQQQAERSANMSDVSKLQDELIAAAEAEKHAKKPEFQIVEKIAEGTPAQPAVPGGTQVIVVQAPAPQRQARLLTDAEREAGRRYRDMKQESILSKSAVGGFDELNRDNSNSEPPLTREEIMLKMMENLANGENTNTLANAAVMPQGAQGEDPNAYRHKLDFLTSQGGERTPQGYSANTRQNPLAPMELKAGTVIPGLLLVGVNSDLPGTVIGQVSENVYDTATGRYLLIPQGTRILGVYDSRITYGQKRVAIVWNRLIYPDGSSLNIAGSPGTDLAGYSGIKGRVNNHYGHLFTAGLFTSIFTAAADIASGGGSDNDANNNRKSAKDVLVETTGTTIANAGARLAERALDIQPTITVSPGSRFNVMVTQDIVFTSSWNSAGTLVNGF